MKIFDNEEIGKINFVDKNNVVVGFDNSSQCCEDFGYFFIPTIPTQEEIEKHNGVEFDPEKYIFDTSFVRLESDNMDSGGVAIFRLAEVKEEYSAVGYWNKDSKFMYLVLYNHHNGYYSHGFDMKKKDKVIVEASL
jgi:hypothetical protein